MRLKLPLLKITTAILIFSSCGKIDFSGDYSFLVGQSVVATNPFDKSVLEGMFKLPDNKSRVMGLAPLKIKLIKEGKDYKGQMSMTTLQKQSLMGMTDDTSEVAFEMKNFIASGDTLNFLISNDVPLMGNHQFKGIIVKGKENIIGIQKDVMDEPDCFEQNPAYVGKDGQMFLFRELNISGTEAIKQMAQNYRDCLVEKAKEETNKFSKKHKMKAVMYVDSVLLRAE